MAPEKKSITKRALFLGAFLVAAVGAGVFFFQARNVKPNIVFITLDSLRADHLGCYGYQRNTSPNIDALSREGALFSQAVSQASWTTASVSSIITSLYPSHEMGQLGYGVNPKDKNLIRILKKNGYTTALFSDAPTILDITLSNIKGDFDVCVKQGNRTNGLVDSVRRWINNVSRKPVFLWVYFFDVHWPYRAAEVYSAEFLSDGLYPHQNVPIAEDDGRRNEFFSFGRISRTVAEKGITDTSYYIAKYDGGIKFADEQVGRLLRALRDRGMDKNTLVVLFADHGESMTEHNLYFNHSHYLYEGLVRVPLIMVFPDKIPSKIIRRQVTMLDVMPSVLEIVGVRNNEPMEGESLLPLIGGKESRSGEYVFSESSFSPYPRCVRSENWKLIHNRGSGYNQSGKDYELYDLKADPGELHNLAEDYPQIAALLKDKLDRWDKNAGTCQLIPPKNNGEEKMKELRSAGYIQ